MTLPLPNVVGDLQVWYVVNPPNKPMWLKVKTWQEGKRLIERLIKVQLADDKIYSNAFGLCEWDGEEFTEWYNEDGDKDIMDIVREEEWSAN